MDPAHTYARLAVGNAKSVDKCRRAHLPLPSPHDTHHSGAGLGVVTYNLRGFTPEEVVVVGTKARLVLKGPAHICTRVVLVTPDGRSGLKEEVFDLPLPAPDAGHAYFYPGSEGFQHEVAEVQRCLGLKLLESPLYSHQVRGGCAPAATPARRALPLAS